MDPSLVHKHNLPVTSVPLIELKLFDGTSNSVITQSLALPVLFPTGESMTIDFYVTTFDSSCAVVLGYNWLTRYNLLIDWVLGHITFRPQLLDLLNPNLMSSARVAQLPSQNHSVSNETPKPSDSALSISLINAAAFMHASKLPGSRCYRLNLSDISASARTETTSEEPPDLSQIPEEYHDFADVFSKSKAYNLAPHCPYDLKIDIEEGATLPISLMYQLSQVELQTLCNFIDEHLRSGFIRQTSSPHGAPVLFVKKKDGGLRLLPWSKQDLQERPLPTTVHF